MQFAEQPSLQKCQQRSKSKLHLFCPATSRAGLRKGSLEWFPPIWGWPRSEIMARSKLYFALLFLYDHVCLSLQEKPCIIMWRSHGSLTWGHRLKEIYKESRDVFCQIFWIILFHSKVWTKFIAVLALPIPSIRFYFDFLCRWNTKPSMSKKTWFRPSLQNIAFNGKKRKGNFSATQTDRNSFAIDICSNIAQCMGSGLSACWAVRSFHPWSFSHAKKACQDFFSESQFCLHLQSSYLGSLSLCMQAEE